MIFEVYPVSCLQDEPSTVVAKNLLPHQHVTITCHLEDHLGHIFFSYAHFVATDDGVVDVSVANSIGGSYFGCIRMGLMSTLLPGPNEYKYLRFFKVNVQEPDKVQFQIFDGHCSLQTLFIPDNHPLKCIIHYRHYMGLGVERLKISEGRLTGVLFLPASHTPQPGVIDMYGTGGRLLEHRAALLASRGFVSFSLAYFDTENPFSNLDLNYFKEAVSFLLKQPKVSKPYIGVVGISKGGELALTISAFIPEIKVTVCINAPTVNTLTNFLVDEQTILPPMPPDVSGIKIIDKECCINRGLHNDPQLFPECMAPLAQSNSHFLFIVGEDDQALTSERMASNAIDTLKSAGKDNYKLLSYKGAGHLIEPPYLPHCKISFHKVDSLIFMWGGHALPHMKAQENAWQEILRVLRFHLKEPSKL